MDAADAVDAVGVDEVEAAALVVEEAAAAAAVVVVVVAAAAVAVEISQDQGKERRVGTRSCALLRSGR